MTAPEDPLLRNVGTSDPIGSAETVDAPSRSHEQKADHSSDPTTLLGNAKKVLPAVRYAEGGVGIAAAVALIASILHNVQIAAFGIPGVLCLMFLLRIFEHFLKEPGGLKWPGLVIAWFATLALMTLATFAMWQYLIRPVIGINTVAVTTPPMVATAPGTNDPPRPIESNSRPGSTAQNTVAPPDPTSHPLAAGKQDQPSKDGANLNRAVALQPKQFCSFSDRKIITGRSCILVLPKEPAKYEEVGMGKSLQLTAALKSATIFVPFGSYGAPDDHRMVDLTIEVRLLKIGDRDPKKAIPMRFEYTAAGCAPCLKFIMVPLKEGQTKQLLVRIPLTYEASLAGDLALIDAESSLGNLTVLDSTYDRR